MIVIESLAVSKISTQLKVSRRVLKVNKNAKWQGPGGIVEVAIS